MDKQDWYDCGARIGDIVNDAIRDNDFQSLNETIANVLFDSLDAVQESMQRARSMQDEAMQSVQSAREKASSAQGKRDGASWRYEGNAYEESRAKAHVLRESPSLLKRLTGGLASGLIGTLAVVLGLFGFMTGWARFGIPALLLGILAVVVYRRSRGSGDEALARTAQQYLDAMGSRDVISVEELAAATGKTRKEVKKDLKKMIQEGRITGEVYLDEEVTTLMTSRDAYQKYQAALKSYQQRTSAAAAQAQKTADEQEQAARRREAEKSMTKYSDETRGILEEGNAFIRHIHEANKQIPDEELTEKLNRLEMVVTRIFEQVAAAPDSAPDLHKMMSYYLPITRKLVDAYVELDRQQVQGQNITKTKQEIEGSLDTINTAFEAFLDSFFQDKAWDIETDIQTLQTMMARDGLTGMDFKKPGDHIKSVAKDVTSQAQGSGAAAIAGEEQQ